MKSNSSQTINDLLALIEANSKGIKSINADLKLRSTTSRSHAASIRVLRERISSVLARLERIDAQKTERKYAETLAYMQKRYTRMVAEVNALSWIVLIALSVAVSALIIQFV